MNTAISQSKLQCWVYQKASNQCCAPIKIETNRWFNMIQPEELSFPFFIPSIFLNIWRKNTVVDSHFPCISSQRTDHIPLPLWPWIWVCFQDLLPVRRGEMFSGKLSPRKTEKIPWITRIGLSYGCIKIIVDH